VRSFREELRFASGRSAMVDGRSGTPHRQLLADLNRHRGSTEALTTSEMDARTTDIPRWSRPALYSRASPNVRAERQARGRPEGRREGGTYRTARLSILENHGRRSGTGGTASGTPRRSGQPSRFAVIKTVSKSMRNEPPWSVRSSSPQRRVDGVEGSARGRRIRCMTAAELKPLILLVALRPRKPPFSDGTGNRGPL